MLMPNWTDFHFGLLFVDVNIQIQNTGDDDDENDDNDDNDDDVDDDDNDDDVEDNDGDDDDLWCWR